VFVIVTAPLTVRDEPTGLHAGGDSKNVDRVTDVVNVVPPTPCANAV
jgi:hypothetical protein